MYEIVIPKGLIVLIRKLLDQQQGLSTCKDHVILLDSYSSTQLLVNKPKHSSKAAESLPPCTVSLDIRVSLVRGS